MTALRRILEDQLVSFSHQMHSRQWVANHDGNISVRLLDGRFLATPTSVSKATVSRENLIVVDDQGKVVSGSGKPFSELSLHLYIYRQRPDVQAVMHAHPPTATGFSVAGVPVRTTMMPEPVVSLGALVPLVPYAAPKKPEWTSGMGPHLADADVLLLEHHGVISVGPDLETAFLRMELVEHLAKIQIAAHQVGLVRDIPDSDIEALLEARTKAGLGHAARVTATAGAQGTDPIREMVANEVSRALHR